MPVCQRQNHGDSVAHVSGPLDVEGDVKLSDAATEKAKDDLSASSSQFTSKLFYS